MRRIGFAAADMTCVALAEPGVAQQRVAFDIAARTIGLAVDAQF